MKLATLRPGIAVGYWKARKRPSRARLSGDSLRMSRPCQMDLAALDHVGRVAHQRVGEGRLARAVGAHDRVDLALADGQVDALEDLVLGRGDRRDAEAADDELVVVGGRCAHEAVRAPWSGSAGWLGADRGARGGTRSARVIESSAPATASRTRTQSRLTVQRGRSVADDRVLGVVAGADHRGDRALEGAQDLGHRDRARRAGELVAAVGAAGAGRRGRRRAG